MINYLSLGAGVQSSTLALMAGCGEITPMPDAAFFADTQNEPQSVYDWLEFLKAALPFPVIVLTKGDLAARHLEIQRNLETGEPYQKSYVPMFTKGIDGKKGILMRKCTHDFKVEIVVKGARVRAAIPRGCKEIMVRMWIGISRDEAHRMKPSQVEWIENVWPLIDKGMSRKDCLAWMESHGFPSPPRSACTFCPYHSDAEWVRLQDQEPEAFASAVEFERRNRAGFLAQKTMKDEPFLHASRVPLDEVEFHPEETKADQMGNECEGMCGV